MVASTTTTTTMNVDQKTVILTALVDFLVEQRYVTADDITEDLLDQFILQKTGRWQFFQSQESSAASSSRCSSMLTEQEQQQQQQQQQQQKNPTAARITTRRSSGVWTTFETSHLSLGWTWESADVFAVQLHLGSGSGISAGAGSASSELKPNNNGAGICRVVHSVDTFSAATSIRGFSENDDDDDTNNNHVEDILPLWVRDALQIQVLLDPVECVVADNINDSNSRNYNNSSIHTNQPSVASLWRTVLGLDFLPTQTKANVVPFTTFQVHCPNVTFVNPAGTCLGKAVNLERTGTSFASVGELQWGNNDSSTTDDDTQSRFFATGLQLAFTSDVAFVHIHTIPQGSLFVNSWRNVTPLTGVQVHWDGVQQLKIQIPPGSEWVLVPVQQANVNIAAFVTANSAARIQPVARPMSITMWAPVVKVVTEQAVLRIGDDYPVIFKGIEISFCEEMNDSIRMMIKASTITLKSCFDVYVLEVAGMLEAGAVAVHALSVHVGEMHSVGNAKVQKWWTVLSQALPFHWISGIYAPHATTSAFKSVYAMERTVTRVIPGKGHEDFVAFDGDAGTTIGVMLVHYADKIAQDIEMRDSRITRTREAVSDSVATTVVRAAVFGVSMASPIGLVASVAAVGIKDGVSKAANMGKESRGVAEDDHYKFGDVSRGFAASIRKSTTKGKKNRGAAGEDKYAFGDYSRGVSSSFRSNSQNYKGEYDADGDMDEDGVDGGRSESYMAKNKARYGAVAGSSVGAMVGLAVAGPFGLIAGSLAGGAATQSYMSRKQEEKSVGKKGLIDLRVEEENGDQYDHMVEPNQGLAPVSHPKAAVTVATSAASRETLPSHDGKAQPFCLGDHLRSLMKKEEVKNDRKKGLIDLQADEGNGDHYEQIAANPSTANKDMLSSPEGEGQPYRLGDNLRGLVSRGQKAAGRDEGSPYKFGDLSRGLFSSKR